MRSSSEHGVRDTLFMLVMTSGGLGLSSVAPGTFGTIGGVVLAMALEPLGAPLALWLALAALLCTAVGIALGAWAERYFGQKDPGAVVLDEVAGYLVTVAFYAAVTGHAPSFAGHCVAFMLFRIADISKPWPGRHLEALPRGWGVMLDDVVLAVYSGLAFAALSFAGL